MLIRRNLNASAGNYLPLTDPANRLGSALLDLLSRGAAILTEISRLADNTPSVLQRANNPGFLLTFEEYFQNPEAQDMRINLSPQVAQLDQAFSQKHRAFIERFYLLCVGIAKLAESFNGMMRDLQRGLYVSHTLEQVLLDADGRQWVPECLHVLATSLLLLDSRFSCRQRQHLLVAYYRANRSLVRQEFDLVLDLFQSITPIATAGSGGVALINPKEHLLARLQVSAQVAHKINMRVRGDDLYHHFRAWPSSEHRSTALGKQSAMLFTSLLVCESVSLPLMGDHVADMREIVDRFFGDTWVVALCNGLQVDLAVEWFPFYPAARVALEQRTLAKQPQLWAANHAAFAACQSNIDELLVRGGVLTEKYVLGNWEYLLGVIRDSNVALRWRLMHGKSSSSSTTADAVDASKCIRMLLSVSRLEEIVKLAIARILEDKPQMFEASKRLVASRMGELAEYFAKPGGEEVGQWFAALQTHMVALEYAKVQLDGRRVLELVRSIEEVERIDAIEDSSLQVKEFLLECKSALENMLAVVHVKEEILVQIEVVSDFQLDWVGRSLAVQYWEAQFRQDPHSVALLSSLFAKLNTSLDQTLYRIVQNPAASQDCANVAEYWGHSIAQFVRNNVLRALPQLVFQELDALPAVSVQDDAEARYALSLVRFKIALWAGHLPPNRTLLGGGAVEFDPKKELLRGLEHELVVRMQSILLYYHDDSSKGRSSNGGGGEDWHRELERKAGQFALLKANLELVLQDYFKRDSLTGMFTRAQDELDAPSQPPSSSYVSFLVGECLMKKVDWFDESQYVGVVDALVGVFGRGPALRRHVLGALQGEIYRVFANEFMTLQTVSFAHLDSAGGGGGAAVQWGSEPWVDAVREARRKYVGADRDFKALKRAGVAWTAMRKIEFMARGESRPAAHAPASTSTRAGPTLKTRMCAKRAFVLMNELAKRMCQQAHHSHPQAAAAAAHGVELSVFANSDYYYAVRGVAFLASEDEDFAQELDRMAKQSASALCARSYAERKAAESSLVFKYGKQKVAKVAMERLVAEQSIHAAIAFAAGRLASSPSTTEGVVSGSMARLMNIAWSV